MVGVKGLSWATIRTFDLGGDKFFPDMKPSRELNPQLGLRAIRFCLKEVELFKIQLRAILRASVQGKLRIMFPMISGIEEIREAKRIFSEVKNELLAKGTELGTDIEIGVMIEVPSAVIVAEELAKEVDFFSIGTNDLIQYVLAIDRINERVTYLYEPLHPAVLRLIKQVVDIGHKAGIRVAMCGEMAGEPAYTMILLGLELDELSMNPLAIPRVKKIIRGATLKESKALLNKVMTFSSTAEIRAFVEAAMRKRFPGGVSGERSIKRGRRSFLMRSGESRGFCVHFRKEEERSEGCPFCRLSDHGPPRSASTMRGVSIGRRISPSTGWSGRCSPRSRSPTRRRKG